MLSHIPEERTLAILLRTAPARLRDPAHRSDLSSVTWQTDTAAQTTVQAEVPLVLPCDRERRLIPRLLRRMRRGRFLRYRPDTLDEYAPLTPYAVDYFLEPLRNAHIDRWRECVVSIWALGRLTSGDVQRGEAEQHLYRILGAGDATHTDTIDTKRFWKRWRLVTRLLFWLPTFAGIGSILVSLMRNRYFPWEEIVQLPCLILEVALMLSAPVTMLTFVCGVPLDMVHRNRMRAMAILTLGRWREPRHLDLLLRSFVEHRGRVRSAAEVALREVLPTLKVGDETELAADFVPNLCRALLRKERQWLDYTTQEEALEILLLEALGKVGAAHALPTLERVAARGRTPRVQELARRILPVVQARARRTTDPDQLLRGTVRPDPAVITLLRPAHEIATPASELLRPR